MKEIFLWGSNEKKDKLLTVQVADSFFSRLCGLMGTAVLPEGRGLLLVNCNSIHMCFMRYALDVVYLSRSGHILKIVGNVCPWRISGCFRAKYVLEVNVGCAKKMDWQVGDMLDIVLKE